MPGIFEGARKAKEKAAAKTSELTSQASDKVDALKIKAEETATDLKGHVAEHVLEVKEVALAKLSPLIDEINAAVPVLGEAGYRMEGVNVKLGIPPSVSVHFSIVGDISPENLDRLIEANEERRMAVFLVKSLSQARSVQSKIKVAGLEPIGLSVDLGVLPLVGIKFGRSKLPAPIPQQQLLTETTTDEGKNNAIPG